MTSSRREPRRAHRLAVSFVVVAAVAGCAPSQSGNGTGPIEPNSVRTVLLSFEPASLTVKVGTTVTWRDTDSISHTVTTGTFVLGQDGLRTSQHPDGLINMPLTKGTSVNYTFTTPGTYAYYCSIHEGMTGRIVVTQ